MILFFFCRFQWYIQTVWNNKKKLIIIVCEKEGIRNYIHIWINLRDSITCHLAEILRANRLKRASFRWKMICETVCILCLISTFLAGWKTPHNGSTHQMEQTLAAVFFHSSIARARALSQTTEHTWMNSRVCLCLADLWLDSFLFIKELHTGQLVALAATQHTFKAPRKIIPLKWLLSLQMA